MSINLTVAGQFADNSFQGGLSKVPNSGHKRVFAELSSHSELSSVAPAAKKAMTSTLIAGCPIPRHPNSSMSYSNERLTGKVTLRDGTVCEGDFINNKLHGKGKKTQVNGVILEGDFEHGKFIKGKTFKGLLLNGKPVMGEVVFPDGVIYTGKFANGRPHGAAKLTFPNGVTIERNFEDRMDVR